MSDTESLGRYAPYIAEPDESRSRTAPPSQLIFRATTSAHLAAAAQLAAEREQGSQSDWLAKLSSYANEDDRALFIAKDGTSGQVFGYGLVREMTFTPRTAPDGLYLVGLVVAATSRRRGLGKLLTLARIRWAFERSDLVWYFANTRNRPSIELHSKLGFVESDAAFQIPGVTFDGGPEHGGLFKLSRSSFTI